jgi:hypothetical protein
MNLAATCSTMVIVAVLTLPAVGCYPRSDRYLDGRERPAKADDAPVDVWYSGQTVPRPYKPIVLLRVTANNGPDYVAKIRRECRKYGADAAVFQNVRGQESSGGALILNGAGGASSSSKDVIEVLGVLYTDKPDPADLVAPEPASDEPRRNGKR